MINMKFNNYCNNIRKNYELNRSVLLVQLPQFNINNVDYECAKSRGYYAYPPFGLMMLKKAVCLEDIEINIVDLNLLILKEISNNNDFNVESDWLNLLDDYIERFSPSIIGVSTISVSVNPDDSSYHLTQFLTKYSKNNKYVLIAGGPNASDNYDYYLKNKLCNFVVTKEGEYQFNMLINYLMNGFNPSEDISGVMYFDGDVSKSKGISDAVIVNQNIISLYDDLNIEEYNLYGSLNPFSRMTGIHKHYSTIQLKRGCRADCKFCGVTEFMGRGVRTTPVDLVISELKYLVEQRNITHIEFLDDDLLGGGLKGKESVIALLNAMSSLHESHNLTWSAGNGLIATSLDDELLKLFDQSGCIGFRIGVESANEVMLKQLRKPSNLSRLIDVGNMLQKHRDIFVGANYIIGLFGVETFSQMMDTFNFSNKLSIDWSSFSTYQFTNKDNAKRKNIKTDGKSANEFVPVKNIVTKSTGNSKSNIQKGMDIFGISHNSIPTREQVDEIWFTFNLLSNYVFNKNFNKNGNHKKIVSWIQSAMVPYPTNPYMPLFSALGLLMLGSKAQASDMFSLSEKRLLSSVYWNDRFSQFHLHNLLNERPTDDEGAFQAIQELQKTLSTSTTYLRKVLRTD